MAAGASVGVWLRGWVWGWAGGRACALLRAGRGWISRHPFAAFEAVGKLGLKSQPLKPPNPLTSIPKPLLPCQQFVVIRAFGRFRVYNLWGFRVLDLGAQVSAGAQGFRLAVGTPETCSSGAESYQNLEAVPVSAV